MKNKILTALSIALCWALGSCQQPEKILSTRNGNSISSITAYFPGDANSDDGFKSEIDYENHIIKIIFPYNYPALSDAILSEDMLKKVRIKAILENNVIIDPPVLFMDLTQKNVITVIDNSARTRTEYTVVAEIRKSAECELSMFNISAAGLSGVINDADFSVSFVTLDYIGEQLLSEEDFKISHGASCSPDPRKVALNYEIPQTITVTAQNGTDKKEYVISKSVPAKIKFGIRPNSGKTLWAKKLSEIQGVLNPAKVTGLAATDEYVVLNERGNASSVYLNLKTGNVAGTMDLSEFASDNGNFHATSDSVGNILFCNWTPSASKIFTVWKAGDVREKPIKFIEYSIDPPTARFGWHISVHGNLNKNALISVPVFPSDAANKMEYALWQVIDGSLKSQAPLIIEFPPISDYNNNWTKWADVVCADDTDPDCDYFIANYVRVTNGGARYFYWISNGSIKTTGPAAPSNTITPAVDYTRFNNSSFLLYNFVNTFTWGVKLSDAVNLYDISSGMIENPIFVCNPNTYGAIAAGTNNSEGTADVLFKVDANGYFLYVLFLFSNGSVGCVQFDCVDM